MQNLLRSLLVMTLALLAPIVPFLLWGDRIEGQVNEWMKQESGAAATAALVTGLLASDILLPIPSSFVITIAGARLGWFAATAAAWVGMSLGATIAFAIARQFGRRAVLWFAAESTLEQLQRATDQWGTLVLVAARGLPIVAEASVLLVGLHRMSWPRFLPAVLLSNLGIALTYSAFGSLAQHYSWLPTALGISLALPVLLAVFIKRYLAKETQQND